MGASRRLSLRAYENFMEVRIFWRRYALGNFPQVTISMVLIIYVIDYSPLVAGTDGDCPIAFLPLKPFSGMKLM